MNKKKYKEFKDLLVLIIIAFTVKTCLIEIYIVPTGSMEKTILIGDMLFGNKFIYGMKTPTWIGIPYTRMGFDVPWYRFPDFREVKNGDVTIFEFPRDPFQKYVKRCIGIPGDSIYIQSGTIVINGKEMEFPEDAKYVKGYKYGPDKIEKLYISFSGNRDNLNGFLVPYKGMVLDFTKISNWQKVITLLVQDGNEVKLGEKIFSMIDPYEVARTHGFLKNKLIRLMSSGRQAAMREQREQTRYINKLNQIYKEKNLVNPWHINFGLENENYLRKNIRLNGKPLKDIRKYILKRDYYFFMGDNRDSSYDSRFWGFVPDSHILGTPLFALVNLFKLKLRLKIIS